MNDQGKRVQREELHHVLPSPDGTMILPKRLKPAPFKTRFISPRDHDTERTNDEIHTSISFCPVIRAIVDTRVFQRLRGIQQLARADLVFMNTNHSRFEHSLGVAHLAERLCRRLQEQHPKLNISHKDVLCVKLAGLLHDIGHGPFSHTYEVVVKNALPQYLDDHPDLKVHYAGYPKLAKDWCHEKVSLDMIDLCLDELGLQIDYQELDRPLKQIGDGLDRCSMRCFNSFKNENDDFSITKVHYNDDDDILTSRDFCFIKECILGRPLPRFNGFIGRTNMYKEFLYDIVCNRHSGLDVDKIDYFARDERRAIWASGEIETLMVDEAVVAWAACTADRGSCSSCNRPGHKHHKHHLMICYPEKRIPDCLRFFKKRYTNHDTIYKHKTARAGQLLMCDILCQADPFFRIFTPHPFVKRGPLFPQNFEKLPLSLAMLDPYVFMDLDDSIFELILHSPDPRLNPAKKLIYERYKSRKLYKCVGWEVIDRKYEIGMNIWEKSESQIAAEMLTMGGEHRDSDGRPLILEKADFVLDKCSSNYGSGDKNPLEKMRFVRREDMSTHKKHRPAEDLPVAILFDEKRFSTELPRSFESNIIRVYSRNDQKSDLVGHVFAMWIEKALSGKAGIFSMTSDPEEADDDEEEDCKLPPVELSQESIPENFREFYGEDDDDDKSIAL
ncbi:hypothetical protein FisN_16Lh284 [Fistulifera solaris]|uniref:HD domain-containing protein n=1 Tax=Fistulifera solaris TaxID=1519565 RepID=A0A1Z5KNW8_FISSO|nr:hypothetical protein FisN_16Lh284 [Fistulifera solaris]|eukprot:GAX28013.1 hypothetical protein FisN_16Lh284 [Fistulifera solaris]